VQCLSELSASPALSAAVEDEFVHQRRFVITEVLNDQSHEGKIDAGAIGDEIWDVLPNYLVSRFLILAVHPTDDETVRALVDDVLMPSLTRTQPVQQTAHDATPSVPLAAQRRATPGVGQCPESLDRAAARRAN